MNKNEKGGTPADMVFMQTLTDNQFVKFMDAVDILPGVSLKKEEITADWARQEISKWFKDMDSSEDNSKKKLDGE